MPEVTSPHIWHPSGYPGTAYDLRYAISWVRPQESPAAVDVRFAGDTLSIVRFPDFTAFETAKEASLAAEA